MDEPQRIGEVLDQVTPAAARPAAPADTEIVRLAKLVTVMRAAQKRWFAGDRSPNHFKLCRDLEGRVDRALSWVLRHRQGDLFAGDGEKRPGAYDKA